MTEKGLPAAPEAERWVLGLVFLSPERMASVAAALTVEEFSLERNRRIYRRMLGLHERGEPIDRGTVYAELDRYGEVESVDGLSGLISLTDGLPESAHIEAYIRQIKEKSRLRGVIFAAQNAMNRALAGEETANEIISAAGESLLSLQASHEDLGAQTPSEIIQAYEGGISTFLDPSRQEQGVQTGFIKLDDMTNGFHAGELIIIAARPSMGKSALLLNIAEKVAVRDKHPVVIFTLEVPKHNVLRRMMCSLARVDQHKFRKGYLSADERRRCNVALNKILESPLLIHDTASLTVMDIRSTLLRVQAKYGKPWLVGVDYLQLMGSKGRFENRNLEVTMQSRGMKLIAKDLGIPMVVLSQLSRKVEERGRDHRPRLGDLRDSGSLEQDADLVGFIFRPEMYDRKRDDIKGNAEFIIAKQREGGVGTVNLVFLEPIVRFENRADDMPVPED